MTRTLSLRTWLGFSHLAVLFSPILVFLGAGILSDELQAQTREDLRNQAALLALLVEQALDDQVDRTGQASMGDLDAQLTSVLVRARERTLAGVRVVDHTGVVVASSGDERGEDLSDRPEVAAAILGAVALDVRPRPPPTLNPLDSQSRRAHVRLFLGAPVVHDGQTVGAVILSRTPREELQVIYQALPWWGVVAPFLLTLLVATFASRLSSRSMMRLADTARRVAEGDFGAVTELEAPRNSHVVEVRQLATAFASMTERLQARLGYISEFAGNVSHEFKTPIATVRATLELLEDDPDMAPEQRQRFLDNAQTDLVRLQHLVTGLLALARAEEGADRRRVDLDALATAVAERFGDVAVTGHAGLVTVSAEQVASALDNLVENAFRHGGDDVKVRIVLGREPDAVTVTVEDDGGGIEPANLPRVFDRFFTTARDDAGTGIGLALVRTVASAHGGTVHVKSVPGQTAFTLRLPARSPPPARA